MSEHESKSEMARLLRRIELEYQAMQRALTGPALGAAHHEFIRARNENIGRYHEQLVTQVGDAEAIHMVYDVHVSVIGE